MSIRSLRAAVSFLTVLPVANADGSPGERLGRAYFPAIGALVGGVAWTVYALTTSFASSPLAAALAVGALCGLTGAIHLDGLADTADGLFGHRGNAAQRLEVMRDPRLGSYGVTAIVVVLIIDVAALSAMTPARALAALLIAGALSRAATLYLIAFVPYVRSAGPRTPAWGQERRALDVIVGSAIVLIISLLDWRRTLVALPLVALITVRFGVLARRNLGGATGDICGAIAELSQVSVLVVFAASLR